MLTEDRAAVIAAGMLSNERWMKSTVESAKLESIPCHKYLASAAIDVTEAIEEEVKRRDAARPIKPTPEPSDGQSFKP